MHTEHSEDILKSLPHVRGRYSLQVDLSKIVWFRVGGLAQVVFKPADVQDLAFFLKEKPADIPVTVIGVGSNILIRDGGIPGVVIRLGRGFTNLALRGGYLDVGAGVLDRSIAMISQEESLASLEFMCGIPGTLGGALRMNAGCYGTEIKDVLDVAFLLDPEGRLHKFTLEDLGFSYRSCSIPDNWIFVGARLKAPVGNSKVIRETIERMLKEREQTQPIHSRTGGSTFANPGSERAWELIDKANCRGLQIGGAQMSSLHCNFMINTGHATAWDLESLGEEVRRRVFATSGVSLEWEIRRIGQYLSSREHKQVA
jgi:UDP-N-acetylmuramate dehydrogenase